MSQGMAIHYQISLHVSRGRYRTAVDLLQEGIQLSDRIGQSDHTTGFKARLADAYISQGNHDLAAKTCDEVIDWAIRTGMISAQIHGLTLKSLTFLKAGMIDSASALTMRIKHLCDESLIRNIGRYYHVHLGYIDLFEEKYTDAIPEFKKAVALLPHESMEPDMHVLFMEPLAMAYYRSGDLDNALKAFTADQALLG